MLYVVKIHKNSQIGEIKTSSETNQNLTRYSNSTSPELRYILKGGCLSKQTETLRS